MSLKTHLHPLPEAYILGAMRAGTTYLHSALEQHPNVASARRKELQYFSLHWEKGIEYYRKLLPLRWPKRMYALAGRKRPMVIDATPYYLFHPEAPARMRGTVGPQAKFVVLLREPGSRAWSHYQKILADGWEHLGFRDAIAQEANRLSMERKYKDRSATMSDHLLFSYVSRGFYARQLKLWWQHFPRENFLILNSDDLFRGPQKTLDQVCDFYSLSRMPLPENLKKNATSGAVMPPDIREQLDTIFAAPNRELKELTGISWPSPIAKPTKIEAACS